MKEKNETIKLLIVDDEQEFLESISKALQRRGFIVDTALDGASALALIADQIFDAVVLDIKMPGLDGVEVFQHIKRLSPNLPVIMLTGHGNIQQAFDTSKDGVFEYLTKPCSVEKIVDVVRASLGRSKGDERDDRDEQTEVIRLLVVDDIPDSLESLCKILRHPEFNITAASDAEEAFRLIEKLYFDVVLLNIKTPNVQATALVRHIKHLHPLSEIILIADMSSTVATMGGIEEQLFATLVKPIAPNAIADKIREAYRRKKQEQDKQRESNIRNILERNTE